mmetsp:Transcript_5527/g.8465  ORF Transcript_5527/g.8465 Transcript_5527/m.8465 type:complete len:83 (+) Transcript_5527:61-309(+)
MAMHQLGIRRVSEEWIVCSNLQHLFVKIYHIGMSPIWKIMKVFSLTQRPVMTSILLVFLVVIDDRLVVLLLQLLFLFCSLCR